jgi:hypothetical protein
MPWILEWLCCVAAGLLLNVTLNVSRERKIDPFTRAAPCPSEAPGPARHLAAGAGSPHPRPARAGCAATGCPLRRPGPPAPPL